MNKLTVTIDNQAFEVEVAPNRSVPGEFSVTVDGRPMKVFVPDYDKPEFADWMIVGNRPYELNIAADLRSVQTGAGRYNIHVRDQEILTARPAIGDGRVKAPIPGLITRIHVKPGQFVESGQPVLNLEAMKMENEIRSPRSGVVRELAVKPGQSVALNDLLLEIE